MKLTWTFYPKGQPSITLTVVYVPGLDAVPVAGYLAVDTNTAYVNWANFQGLQLHGSGVKEIPVRFAD